MNASRGGLTLAEAVLALFVLVVAYVPLAELYHITTAQTVKSRNVLLAQNMAQTVFETYRMSANDLLQALSGKGTLTTGDLLADKTWRERLTGRAPEVDGVLKAAEFKIAVTVQAADPQVKGLDRVELAMTWKEGGHELSRKYARLIVR